MNSNADAKEERFLVQLNKLNSLMTELISDAPINICSDDNLTMSQLRVLLLLKINNSMKMAKIASCLKIHVSTATGLVDRLIAKKLVKREVSEEDRRVVLCSLSDKGEKITDSVWKIVWEHAHSLSDFITMEELDIIGSAIDILQKAWVNRKEKLGSSVIA
jgi:DNA-binding MarR family transcriptional regulator